ncbi:MAG: GIY-YIG nuclease family protein [Christensenellales bacterium]
MFYAYILKCADGSLYSGWTDDLAKRIRVHNSGKGGKYTRGRLPVSLFYNEIFQTRGEAMRRECAFKKMSRNDKLKLKL